MSQKVSLSFFIFLNFFITFYVGSGSNAGSGAGTGTVMNSGSGSTTLLDRGRQLPYFGSSLDQDPDSIGYVYPDPNSRTTGSREANMASNNKKMKKFHVLRAECSLFSVSLN